MGAFHAPGQRYHPVISAQAMATAAAMFPGRLPWVALGSGEALNEHVTGDPWPTKPERMARLRECVEVMRALWRGEEVSHRGQVVVDRARLWSLPDEPPQLVAGAISAETAAWAAQWADGLITVNQPVGQLRRIVDAYRGAGGRGPIRLQVHLSYAATRRRGVGHRRRPVAGQLRADPAGLGSDHRRSSSRRRPGTSRTRKSPPTCGSRPTSAAHRAGWQEYLDLGFDELYLHHVGQHNEAFIAAFGARGAARPSECGMRATQTGDLWWKTAVVYCLDVQTFYDSNGDGIGDFAGLSERLDHLVELGVTVVWLMPFYPTADVDDGYDITDFYTVDPRLGTLGDFVEFIALRPVAGPAGDRRSGRQPHQREASLVPIGPVVGGIAVPGLVCLA